MAKNSLVVIGAVLLGFFYMPSQAHAADLTVNHAINAGECADSTSNGQPVKICRDSSGQYKIQPSGFSAVNAPPDQLSDKPSTPKEEETNICHHRGDYAEGTLSYSMASKACDVVADWEKIKDYLVKNGICDDCAINIVDAYARGKNAEIVKLVKSAREGNADSLYHLGSTQYMVPIPDDPTLAPKNDQNVALNKLVKCYALSITNGELGEDSFKHCLSIGIDWCNAVGRKTSYDVKISPITGQVSMDNGMCGIDLEGLYKKTASDYDWEMENYSGAINSGKPYKPVFLDIRPYIGTPALQKVNAHDLQQPQAAESTQKTTEGFKPSIETNDGFPKITHVRSLLLLGAVSMGIGFLLRWIWRKSRKGLMHFLIVISVIAIGVVVSASQSIGANTKNDTTLICKDASDTNLPGNTIEFNADKSTAKITIDAGVSSGLLKATLDSNTVTFDWDRPASPNSAVLSWKAGDPPLIIIASYQHYIVNRVTLALLIYDGSEAPWDQATPEERKKLEARHYTCQIGKAQF